MKSVVIDGVRYVEDSPDGDVRLLILHRGWIVVGRVSTDGENVVARNASVVRKWGTSRGLGQIAIDGPTPKTVLDPCGTFIVHKMAIVGQIVCEASKWTQKFL